MKDILSTIFLVIAGFYAIWVAYSAIIKWGNL
jgi:hypothetical protein